MVINIGSENLQITVIYNFHEIKSFITKIHENRSLLFFRKAAKIKANLYSSEGCTEERESNFCN